MLHRFLHNKTAVGTVSLVLIVVLIGTLPRSLPRMTLTLPTFSTNLPTSARNIRWAPITWAAAFFPAWSTASAQPLGLLF